MSYKIIVGVRYHNGKKQVELLASTIKKISDKEIIKRVRYTAYYDVGLYLILEDTVIPITSHSEYVAIVDSEKAWYK